MFKFSTRFALALALPMALVAPAQSADTLLACGKDVETYCGAVEPGHGRIIACLYAHELVVSDQCDAAIGDVANVLDTMFEGLWTIQTECGDDIINQCGEVTPGEGRVFSCLYESRDSLSDSCAAIIDIMPAPLGTE